MRAHREHPTPTAFPDAVAVGAIPGPRIGPRPVRSRGPASEMDQEMTRFILWLARQPVPGAQRSRYERCAERFLRWQAAGADPHADRTAARYLLQMRRGGDSCTEQANARAAIALLQRHRILTTRQDWNRPSN
jgi:hypothetical protein